MAQNPCGFGWVHASTHSARRELEKLSRVAGCALQHEDEEALRVASSEGRTADVQRYIEHEGARLVPSSQHQHQHQHQHPGQRMALSRWVARHVAGIGEQQADVRRDAADVGGESDPHQLQHQHQHQHRHRARVR